MSTCAAYRLFILSIFTVSLLGASNARAVTVPYLLATPPTTNAQSVGTTGTAFPLDTNHSLASGLQAYYKLDDTSDASGNGHALTNNNAVSFDLGKIGDAADFGSNNTNKYLSTASTFGIDGGPISISAWVKIETQPPTNTNATIVYQESTSSHTVYRIGYFDQNGAKGIWCNRETPGNGLTPLMQFPYALTTGLWYHVVYRYDGTTENCFVNDVNQATTTANLVGSAVNIGQGYAIGGQTDGSIPVSGQVDEVGVWSRSLSDQEVQDLYNNGCGDPLGQMVADCRNATIATFVSDTTWDVFAAFPTTGAAPLGKAVVLCGIFWSCGPFATIIPGATPIWAPVNITDPADLAQFFFAKTITLPGIPVGGTVTVAADDLAEVFVNGVSAGPPHGSITNPAFSGTRQTGGYDVGRLLQPGDNSIVVRGQNGSNIFSGAGCSVCTYAQNPASVVFSGSLLSIQQFGTILVSTNNAAATFTITDGGSNNFSGSGASFTQTASPGTYTVTFGPIAGLITPTPQTQTLAAGTTISFTGVYQQPPPPPVITSISPDSAVQGSTVSSFAVSGDNFISGAAINFTPNSGITTIFISTTTKQLLVDLAIDSTATPGPRTVSVTNPDSQSATSGTQFIVLPKNPAVVGTVKLSNGNPLSNTVVALVGPPPDFAKKNLTKTNEDGKYEFADIAGGDYVIAVSSGTQDQTFTENSNDGVHGYLFQPSFCRKAANSPCPQIGGLITEDFIAQPKPSPFALKLPLPAAYVSDAGVQTPAQWRVITEAGGYVKGSDGAADADPAHTDTRNGGYYALDLVPSGAAESFVAPILAAADGTVVDLTLASSGNAFGNSVVLRPDGSNLAVRYAHLASFAPGIQKNAVVKTGDVLGCMGSTGAAAVHLHFQVYDGGLDGTFSRSSDPLLQALRIETADKPLAFVEFVAGHAYTSTNTSVSPTVCP